MKKIEGARGGTLIVPEKGDVLNPKGRGKGVLNRATVLRNLLDSTIERKNPLTGELEHLTVGQLIDYQMIKIILDENSNDMARIAAHRELYKFELNEKQKADEDENQLVVQTKTVVEFSGLTQKLWEYGQQKQNEQKDK